MIATEVRRHGCKLLGAKIITTPSLSPLTFFYYYPQASDTMWLRRLLSRRFRSARDHPSDTQANHDFDLKLWRAKVGSCISTIGWRA